MSKAGKVEWAIKALVNPELLFSSFGISRSIALNGHFLRFATAAFFHVNFGHFISNFIGLIIFLTILEYAAGPYRALIIVLISALGGTVGSIVYEWVNVMVGASTILFGVFGAIGMLILRYQHELGKYSMLITIIWLIDVITSAMAGYMEFLTFLDGG